MSFPQPYLLKTSTLVLLLMLVTLNLYGQTELIKLKENVFEFSPDSATILKPILEEVALSDVVFLGERDHGDGSSHDIKYQLIRQLHHKASLAAVVFEADFFALNHKAQERSLKERLVSLYPIWTECSQFNKIEKYIIDNQIGVYGSDPRLMSPYSKAHLIPYLEAILPDDARKGYLLSELKALQEKEYFIERTQVQKEDLLELLHTYQKSFEEGFNRQLLLTIEAFAQNSWQGLNPRKQIFYRDISMGENLFWLKSSWLKDAKTAFFGANVHIGNTQKVYDKKAKTTVKAAFDAHGVFKSYAIAIISYEGLSKRPTMNTSYVLSPYKGEGLEKSLAQSGLTFALVNLRDDTLIGKEFYTWALVNAKKEKAVWSNIYDSFIYTKTIQPCGNVNDR